MVIAKRREQLFMSNETTSIRKKIADVTGAVFLALHESGSKEWLELRKTGIGGSEVAAICGFSKWTSPYTLWCQKVGIISDTIAPNSAMEWGTRLEPVIMDKFEDAHPELSIYRDIGTWHHQSRRWQVTNPDGIFETASGELGVIEVKTAMYEDDWKNGVPRYYETQVQWYLQTFGLDKAYVVVLFHGNSYVEYEVFANDFAQGIALEEVQAFLHYVENKVQPDYDGSKSTLETVRYQNPEINPDLEVEVGDLGFEYLEANLAYLSAQQKLNLSKSKVLAVMGLAKKGLVAGKPAFTRTSRSGSVPFLTFKQGEIE